MKGLSRALVDPVVRERNLVAKQFWIGTRKSLCVYLRSPYRKPTQVDRKRILRPTGRRVVKELGKLTP